MSQICFLNINLPLKWGRPFIQDTSPAPQGVYNRGVPLYIPNQWHNNMITWSHVIIQNSKGVGTLLNELVRIAPKILLLLWCHYLSRGVLVLTNSLSRVGILVLNEIFRSRNKVIKHILFLLEYPGLVPTVSVLTAAETQKCSNMLKWKT